ncbi:MAG: hypothetical protein SFV32_02245 [Opitutaceae bacterium]|nr:hypothetical protein [Opitutaceae bacterium]
MNRLATTAFLAGVIFAATLVMAGCRRTPASDLEVVGQIESSDIDEASGLAPSREKGVYWCHNDSGGKPLLFAIDRKGREKGRIRVKGVRNDDWEDLASFEQGGKRYLLIGEVGDNAGERPHATFYVVEEPASSLLKPGKAIEVVPAWSQKVRFSNGPRDCEAVAVDETGRKAYILSKRDFPALLYVVNLGPEFSDAAALLVGEVKSLPQPSQFQAALPAPRGKYLGWPTGMSFSPDGTWAVILSYGHIAVFERKGDEPWHVTLGRSPTALVAHDILQAEAVCTVPGEKTVLATGEGVGATLYRWRWNRASP